MKISDKHLKIIAFILVCQMAGVIGSLFTAGSISTWYLTLEKPGFNPPNWVFAPVWISLYALMGVSAFLVYDSKSPKRRSALMIFGLQLILNALWSIAFFGLQSPFFGLLVISLLWVSIVATMRAFLDISRTAFYLLIPYILWVSFAGILNYMIWILNA